MFQPVPPDLRFGIIEGFIVLGIGLQEGGPEMCRFSPEPWSLLG